MRPLAIAAGVAARSGAGRSPRASRRPPAARPRRGGAACDVDESRAGVHGDVDPASPLTVYLQVGVGSFSNDYISGGQPQNNTTINTVSATVAANVVGNSTAQAMTTNSTATQSYWDGYAYCSVPGQLYIGGFYRTTGATTAAAQVTATVPAALIGASGGTIPFSKIHWTSSGNGDTGAEPFPAGTFVNGGVQNVGSMGEQHVERELLDVLLFEQHGPAGRHVHRARSLYAECAVTAAARAMVAAALSKPAAALSPGAAAFFFALALSIIWCSADAGQNDHDR